MKSWFDVVPDGSESRHDIIQAISFHNPDALIAFCEGIQRGACGQLVRRKPWAMPGYDSDVIMAAGAFAGFLHRTVCRRTNQTAVCRVFSGWSDLVPCETRHFEIFTKT